VSERILVADDSLVVREAVESALRPRGSRVELAADGTQARARLQEIQPDLLFADVHMPGPDGYTLCREAKSERAATKVVLLVGTFEPFDAGAASAAGADGLLRKPLVADEVLRKVEQLLGPVRAPEPERPPEPEAAEPPPQTAAASVPETTGEAAPEEAVSGAGAVLSDADVDRIARRLLELGMEPVLARMAREMFGGRRGDPERE
jgi:CheY-like chemotaxis protein